MGLCNTVCNVHGVMRAKVDSTEWCVSLESKVMAAFNLGSGLRMTIDPQQCTKEGESMHLSGTLVETNIQFQLVAKLHVNQEKISMRPKEMEVT